MWWDVTELSEARPFPCTKLFTVWAIGDLPGAIPGAGALTTPEGGLFTLEV